MVGSEGGRARGERQLSASGAGADDSSLTSGEPAALAVVDATVRLLPGAMSDHESAYTDSFWDAAAISAPSYTRPPEFRGHVVPDVLLSGDHARIARWKAEEAARLSALRGGNNSGS